MHIYTNTLLLIYNCRSQLNKEKWHEQYIHGCHSHNLSTSKVLTWNDMRLFLQNFMPKRKQNGMIWSFWNLRLICHYVQNLFLTGLVNPGGTDATSEQKGKHPRHRILHGRPTSSSISLCWCPNQQWKLMFCIGCNGTCYKQVNADLTISCVLSPLKLCWALLY